MFTEVRIVKDNADAGAPQINLFSRKTSVSECALKYVLADAACSGSRRPVDTSAYRRGGLDMGSTDANGALASAFHPGDAGRRGHGRRPRPLKVVAAQPARDINDFADEVQPRHVSGFER